MKQESGFWRNSQLWLCLVVFVFSDTNVLLAQVKLTEESWVLPTYQVLPAEKNPEFFKNEVYQGASKYIYPYAMNDMISNEKADHPWKALVLENEYIKLCVTPEIGGKLYYCLLYTSDAADEEDSVDLGGRRIIKKKNKKTYICKKHV